jgi:hypothetical protein
MSYGSPAIYIALEQGAVIALLAILRRMCEFRGPDSGTETGVGH